MYCGGLNQLIYCSITGCSQTGPLSHKAGYDFAIQAEGGLMSITGEPDGEPQKVGVAVVDLMTGVYATTAILAALHSGRTGTGRHIDASLFDVQVAMLANQANNQLIGGKTPKRMGNTNIVPYQAVARHEAHRPRRPPLQPRIRTPAAHQDDMERRRLADGDLVKVKSPAW